MMGSIFSWIKRNKFATLLLALLIYFFGRQILGSLFGVSLMSMSGGIPKSGGGMMNSLGAPSSSFVSDVAESRSSFGMPGIIPPGSQTPPTDQQNRLVIHDTSMSMVVKDVASSLKAIQSKTESLGGFLIQSNLDKPEESANGSISIRVPDNKLNDALEAFRAVGLRVINEQISGQDVTDQYTDLDARLATLSKTKLKFEDILDKAVTVQDLLNVQQQIISLQSQIDSVKGQQQYLSQSAKLSKITVYLSTDEFSLPYAPSEPWRPNVVVKLAIRSLVTNLRGLGSAAIWIGVYSVVWGPILGVIYLLKKRRRSV